MAGNEPVKLTLFTPRTTRRYAVTNEAFVSRGYGLITAIEDPNRQATWSIRQASGLQTLYYRAEVVRVNTREPINPIQPPTIDNPGFDGADLTAAHALVDRIRRGPPTTRPWPRSCSSASTRPQPGDNVAFLLGKHTSAGAKMELAAEDPGPGRGAGPGGPRHRPQGTERDGCPWSTGWKSTTRSGGRPSIPSPAPRASPTITWPGGAAPCPWPG